MAKVKYMVCEENVDKKTLDLCQDELLAGAKALEDLAEEVGDGRAAELCGCSSSHLAESLREIEENICWNVDQMTKHLRLEPEIAASKCPSTTKRSNDFWRLDHPIYHDDGRL